MHESNTFTLTISDRSMRRMQITMAAFQGCEQTARAAAEAAQSMVAQARKSLDEALGAICDANDRTLPGDYSLSLNVEQRTLTITSTERIEPEPDQLRPMPPPGPAELALVNGTTEEGSS